MAAVGVTAMSVFLLTPNVRRYASPSGLRHQASPLQVATAFKVQLRPIATFAAGRKPLCQTSVGQLLVGGVNPAETECLFHDVDVWQRIPFGFLLTIHHHPAHLLAVVVLFKPPSQLASVFQRKKIDDFHTAPYSMINLLVYRSFFLRLLPQLIGFL